MRKPSRKGAQEHYLEMFACIVLFLSTFVRDLGQLVGLLKQRTELKWPRELDHCVELAALVLDHCTCKCPSRLAALTLLEPTRHHYSACLCARQ